MLTVLLIEDDPGDAQILRVWLGLEVPGRYRLLHVDRLAAALAILDEQGVDAVIADLSLPDSRGLATVRALESHLGNAALIVLSGNDDENTAITTMRAGSQDFLVKGHVDGFLLRRSIHYAIERRRLELALEASEARFRNFANASGDWFWETGPNHRLAYISDGFQRVTGIAPGMLLGRDGGEFVGGTDSAVQGRYQEAVRVREPFQDLEYWIELSGRRRCLRVSGVPVFNRRREFTGYQGVGSDITEHKELEDRIARLALVDMLTDLPNRCAFEEALERAAARSRRHGGAIAILYLDLDGFKSVNDTLGHAAGDELLREVAVRLRSCLRAEDMVARLGGDEFAALLTVAAGDACREAEATARRILAALSEPVVTAEGPARVGASIGMAVYPLCCPTAEQCVRDADGAMYAAKHAGKQRVACAASSAGTRARCPLALAPREGRPAAPGYGAPSPSA